MSRPPRFARLKFSARALVACGLCAGPIDLAVADPLSPVRQTCTTLNCNSLSLPGQINGHPASPALATSWVGQFRAQAASCYRFQVTAETHDLAMSVVAPNGTVFTNDNIGAGACTACPRVVVGPVASGFYTVVVGQRNGVTSQATFTLRAGLYDAGNAPNCNNPTPGD